MTLEYSLFENYDRDVASTIYASYSRYEIWMKQIAKKYHAIFLLTAPIIKAGKDNVTILTPGLFGCKEISFQRPFSDGQQVKVFASFGHTVKSPTYRFGAAVWVESVSTGGFTVCVLEYGEGSKGSAEVNWIALQSTPLGSQLGTVALDPWTTGTECITINFEKVRFKRVFIYFCFKRLTKGKT